MINKPILVYDSEGKSYKEVMNLLKNNNIEFDSINVFDNGEKSLVIYYNGMQWKGLDNVKVFIDYYKRKNR